MNRPSALAFHTLIVVAISAGLSACRDAASTGTIAPAPSVQQTAQLVIEPSATGDSVISVVVRITRPAAQRVASLTAAVVFDSTRIRFLHDASAADGGMRAANAARGRLMIAAAHAAGFDDEVLARLRFVVRDTAAYRTFVLQVMELHLLDARDARPTLTTLPTAVLR